MTTFSIYLPAGWSRVDLLDATAIDRTLSDLVRLAPLTRQPPLRALLEDSLRPQLEELAAAGVVCVLAQLDLTDPNPVRSLVAVAPIELVEGTDPTEFVTALASISPGSRLFDVPGLLGLRTTDVRDVSRELIDRLKAFDIPQTEYLELAAVETPPDPRLLSTRVMYVVGGPEATDPWLSVNHVVDSPTGPGGEALKADAIAVVDAMMTTLRWVA